MPCMMLPRHIRHCLSFWEAGVVWRRDSARCPAISFMCVIGTPRASVCYHRHTAALAGLGWAFIYLMVGSIKKRLYSPPCVSLKSLSPQLSHEEREAVDILQRYSGTLRYRVEGVVSNMERYVNLSLKTSVESSQQRAAAREVYTVLHDIGI